MRLLLSDLIAIRSYFLSSREKRQKLRPSFEVVLKKYGITEAEAKELFVRLGEQRTCANGVGVSFRICGNSIIVTCPKCGREGRLQRRAKSSRCYYLVVHEDNGKSRTCHFGRSCLYWGSA